MQPVALTTFHLFTQNIDMADGEMQLAMPAMKFNPLTEVSMWETHKCIQLL